MADFSLKPSDIRVAGKPVHYAWVIVGVGAVMRLFSSSFRSSSSILIPRLVESFGWSYGQVGIGFAIQWIVSGLFGPPAGMMGDKYGVRWTMRLGAVLFIVGMVLTGFMHNLWQFYFFFGVILSAAMGIFQVPLTAAITLWFRKHLGVGMGLLQSSQGIGPLVAVPIMLFIIHQFGGGIDGLRAAFWIPGILGGVIILVLVQLFYNEPAEIDSRPLGAPADEPIMAVQTGEIARVRTKTFLKQAQRTSAFWNLIGIHFWGCAGHAIILVYLASIAEAEGISKGVAAAIFVVLSVTSTVTRFAVPIIADRAGSRPAMAGCFFLQVAPIVLLFFAHDAWQFYLFAVLFGIGFGGEMSAFPIINRQYYGSGPIGTTYGYQMMGAGVGMATGSLLGGFLKDITGNFDATMALSLGLSLTGVVSIFMLPSTKKELLPDWEDQIPDLTAVHSQADD